MRAERNAAGMRGDDSLAKTVPMPRVRRRLRASGCARAALATCAVLALLAGASWFALIHTVSNFPGPHFNRGQNAVWLEHTWAADPHSSTEYDQLAGQLAREQIRYIFAHVGPLASDGSIPADRFAHAGDLVQALRQRAPGIRVLAWIGQLELASGQPADQTVDLSNPNVRQQIAVTAAYFAGPLGFDGVHYDIEPMLNNNAHFLDLLDVTRAALPAGKLISISAPMWAPSARVAELLRSTIGKGAGLWTSYYYAAVATHVDQIVAMEYNTALPTGPLYQVNVKQQTQHILAAARAAPHPPQVLIGLPTYHENSFWFHEAAENLTFGLAGVTDGLNSDPDTAPFAGVAIYRLATTSDADWGTYERLWLGR